MNWYLEAIESGQGKGAFALYDRPGLGLFANLDTSPGRGIITAQGRTFAITGATLWEIFGDGTSTSRGNVGTDGKTVSLANGQNQLLLASAGIAYVLDLTTNALTNISAIFGAPPVLQVGYSDGFFLALLQGTVTNTIQASDLQDATSWDPLSFTGVSVFTDRATAIFIDHREMWVWGPRATQPYFNSGATPFPFDVISGGFIESGIAARFSPAKADNSIFWLESDDRGNAIVRRANGYTPTRVSDHALETELTSYSTIADAIGYSYKEAGHEFYCLSFPTADKMWALDTASGHWAERGFWNIPSGTYTRHRAQYHTFNFAKHIVLDPTIGHAYEQSTQIFTDFDNPMRRVRRAPHVSNEQEVMLHRKLQVDVETGLSTYAGYAQPTIHLVVDGIGFARSLQIDDFGIIQAPIDLLGNAGNAETIFLNDQTNTTTWKLTVDAFGVVNADLQVKFDGSAPGAMQFVSTGAIQRFSLQLKNLGGGLCQLTVYPLGFVGRGANITLRYSDDAGRSWTHGQDRDAGQVGDYRKRVIWRRLGRSRDRIYEISTADATPCRIIDAYLDATSMQPQKRVAHEARERA